MSYGPGSLPECDGAGPDPTAGAAPRAAEWLLAALVFFAGAYFYHGADWSQFSRYDAILSFVEPGTPDYLTFHIDRFLTDPQRHINTGDWAANPRHDQHYYSNKAPGPLLAGVPVYFVLYHGERLLGWAPTSAELTLVNCYLLNLALSVLPLALSAPCFLRLLRRHRGRAGFWWPLALTGGLYFGTLLWPFSTQLWGHVTATATLIIGLYFLTRGDRAGQAASGLWLGLSVLSDYTTALTVVSTLGLLVLQRQWRALVAVGLGGLGPFLALAAYHRLAFGQFLTTASQHSNPAFLCAGAVGGLFHLDRVAWASWGLTFSTYRGLFWYMPVLFLFVAAGAAAGWRLRRNPWYWLCLANLAAYFGLNLVFSGWDAGWCMGPRYQIPALPFYFVLGLLLVDCWPRRQRVAAGCYGLLLTVSVANMFVISAVSPQAPGSMFPPVLPPHPTNDERLVLNPLKYWYISLAKGFLQRWPRAALRPEFATRGGDNGCFLWGGLAGLSGRWAAWPCLGGLLAGMIGVVLLTRRAAAANPPPGSGESPPTAGAP